MTDSLPSDYFRRQCLISSDYPYLYAFFGVVHRQPSPLAALPDSTRRKMLGENAACRYGIEGWFLFSAGGEH